jgi:hypothetical protein
VVFDDWGTNNIAERRQLIAACMIYSDRYKK